MKSIRTSHLRASVVSSPNEIQRLRWFQQRRYVESGLLPELPPVLPLDAAVRRSTYFGVYTSGDNVMTPDPVMATARIVRGASLSMLTQYELFPASRDILAAASGRVSEISRLAVNRATPNYAALALLSREFLRFGIANHEASLLVASVERPLVRMLNQVLRVPVEVIGDEIDQCGPFKGACVPVLIDTSECVRVFSQDNSQRKDFFLEGISPDLVHAVSGLR